MDTKVQLVDGVLRPVPYVESISLRDYFAGQALAGMHGGGWRPDCDESRATLARDAYKAADAMLKERERKP